MEDLFLYVTTEKKIHTQKWPCIPNLSSWEKFHPEILSQPGSCAEECHFAERKYLIEDETSAD
jgi:hypothetical protein